MTALRYARFAVIGLALLAIAWPPSPPRALDGLAGSAWQVVEISGTRTPGAGTVRFTQSTVRGKAACNTFVGAFRQSENAIEIGGLSETRMLCSGRMDLERAFLDALGRARSYRPDGATVLLLDGAGQPLVRLAS